MLHVVIRHGCLASPGGQRSDTAPLDLPVPLSLARDAAIQVRSRSYLLSTSLGRGGLGGRLFRCSPLPNSGFDLIVRVPPARYAALACPIFTVREPYCAAEEVA